MDQWSVCSMALSMASKTVYCLASGQAGLWALMSVPCWGVTSDQPLAKQMMQTMDSWMDARWEAETVDLKDATRESTMELMKESH